MFIFIYCTYIFEGDNHQALLDICPTNDKYLLIHEIEEFNNDLLRKLGCEQFNHHTYLKHLDWIC